MGTGKEVDYKDQCKDDGNAPGTRFGETGAGWGR